MQGSWAPPNVMAELQQMREEVARLRQDKGENESLVKLLRDQIQRSSEDIFELHAHIVTVEAEAQYKCDQSALTLQNHLQRLISRTTFLEEEKRTAEHSRASLEAQLKQLQKTAQVEQKRLEAGKRLLETTKRKHEAEKIQYSQQILSQVVPSQQPSKRMRVAEVMADASLQTDPCQSLTDENNLVLFHVLTLELVALMHPNLVPSNPPPKLNNSMNSSVLDATTDEMSQLMPQFSQWLPPSLAHENPTTFQKSVPMHVTKHLTSTVSDMLAARCTALSLVNALVPYLTAQVESSIVKNSLSVLYSAIRSSRRIQETIAPPPDFSFPSYRLAGWSKPAKQLKPPLEPAHDACDIAQLVHGLQHVLIHYQNMEPTMLSALGVLSYCIGLAGRNLSKFEPVVSTLCELVDTCTDTIVAESLAILGLLIPSTRMFLEIKPNLGRWMSILAASRPKVHGNLLRLYCATCTLYPLESLHRQPHAISTLWDLVQRVWTEYTSKLKEFGVTKQDDGSFLQVLLCLLCNTQTNPPENILESPSKQALMNEILSRLPGAKDAAKGWDLVHVMEKRCNCVLLFAGALENSIHVTVYPNGESTNGVGVYLTREDVVSGQALAQQLSSVVKVDGLYKDSSETTTESIADRVYTGKGDLVESFDDLKENDRLYLVAPGLHFVWPFVEFGHRVAIESHQSPTGKPIVIESFSASPRVFLIHDFFSSVEADGLIDRVLEIDNEQRKLQRSGVGYNSEKKTHSSVRTSENAFDSESPVAVSINKRAFDLLRMGEFNDEMADGLQLLRYQQKQAYIPHTDYFEVDTSKSWNWNPKAKGSNRFATIFLYLSNVTRGGQTVFPLASMPAGVDHASFPSEEEFSIFEKGSWEYKMTKQCYTKMATYPRKAHAVLFYSQTGNGQLDPNSEHGGCPVLEGTKWGANLWVWNKRRYGIDANKLTIDFINNMDISVDLYWSTTWMYTIPPKSTKYYQTYENHEWTIKDLNGNILLIHRAKQVNGEHQSVSVPVNHYNDEL